MTRVGMTYGDIVDESVRLPKQLLIKCDLASICMLQ